MTKLSITARVSYTTTRTAKVKTTTFVTIMVGQQEYATRHLSGKYSQEQALTEFRRFPAKFSPAAGNTVETLTNLAKVA